MTRHDKARQSLGPKPISPQRHLAIAIARRLFTDGQGNHASRLILAVGSEDERHLGGWCESAAIDQIEAVIRAAQ